MEDGGGGHWLVWMEWRPAGLSVCLPLLIFPCTIKSRSSLLAPTHPGGPGKRAVRRLWCGGVITVPVQLTGLIRCEKLFLYAGITVPHHALKFMPAYGLTNVLSSN